MAIITIIKKDKVERRKFKQETNHKIDNLLRRADGSSKPFMPLQGLELEVSDDFAWGG